VIFLLTHFPWDSTTGGGCITRFWANTLAVDEPIFWCSLSKPAGNDVFVHSSILRVSTAAPAWGNLRLRLHAFWQGFNRKVWCRYAAARIKRRLQTLNPRIFWIVADYTLAPVVLKLIPVLNSFRLHISLHDHPASSAERSGVGSADLQAVTRFQELLGSLTLSADGVSEELINCVAPNAVSKAIITLPASPQSPTLTAPGQSGCLSVGLCGNFFGRSEIDCFLSGLEVWAKRSGRDWRLTIFGPDPGVRLDSRIELKGVREVDEVRRELKHVDVLLLPLPVENSVIMRTSVPTKLTTYLEIGSLIFAFAPSNSITESLISTNHLGPVVTTLDPERVAGEIENLVHWDLFAADAGRQRLLAGRYSECRMVTDLRKLLGHSKS
jgi:hypothetical protein